MWVRPFGGDSNGHEDDGHLGASDSRHDRVGQRQIRPPPTTTFDQTNSIADGIDNLVPQPRQRVHKLLPRRRIRVRYADPKPLFTHRHCAPEVAKRKREAESPENRLDPSSVPNLATTGGRDPLSRDFSSLLGFRLHVETLSDVQQLILGEAGVPPVNRRASIAATCPQNAGGRAVHDLIHAVTAFDSFPRGPMVLSGH